MHVKGACVHVKGVCVSGTCITGRETLLSADPEDIVDQQSKEEQSGDFEVWYSHQLDHQHTQSNTQDYRETKPLRHTATV